jgi:hypothetical protein
VSSKLPLFKCEIPENEHVFALTARLSAPSQELIFF